MYIVLLQGIIYRVIRQACTHPIFTLTMIFLEFSNIQRPYFQILEIFFLLTEKYPEEIQTSVFQMITPHLYH